LPLGDYIRETWQNAVTAINATRLNNLESGLDSVTDAVIALEEGGVAGGLATIDTVSSLRALTSSVESDDVRYLEGYYAVGDGGGGYVYYDDAVTATAFTAATDDTFTATAHGLSTGQVVRLAGGSLPTGANSSTDYWVIYLTANTFKLAASSFDAVRIVPVPINLTSTGSGTVILADNGFTVFADSEGRRWRRVPDAAFTLEQAGAKSDGTNTAARIQAAFDISAGLGNSGTIEGTPHKKYKIDTGLTLNLRHVGFDGKGCVLDNSAMTSGVAFTVTSTDQFGDQQHQNPLKRFYLTGNSQTSAVTGMKWHVAVAEAITAPASIAARDLVIEKFGVLVEFGQFSWAINYHDAYLGSGDLAVSKPTGTTASGERHGFEGCTFAGNNKVFENDGGFFHVQNCSFDYNLDLFDVSNGTIFLDTCHVEAFDYAATPINVGTLGYFRMDGGVFMVVDTPPHDFPSIADVQATPGVGGALFRGVYFVHLQPSSTVFNTGPGVCRVEDQIQSYNLQTDLLPRQDSEAIAGQMVTDWGPVSTVYRLLATLPVASVGSYDKVVIELEGGPSFDGLSIISDKFLFGNRGGFYYQHQRGGRDTVNARADMSIVAYQSGASGSEVTIYQKSLVGTYTIGFIRVRGVGTVNQGPGTVLRPGKPTTTTPSGTLVFDSASSSYAPNISMGVGEVVMGNGVRWLSGAGSPEGAVTAPPGSLYTNTSGGSSTTLYAKESGSGNTGWVAR
jgi:hypothetical protein